MEEERVVYDLDADSHSRQLKLPPDDAAALRKRRSPSSRPAERQIFARSSRSVFHLDDSGDETEEENPFASLLQLQEATIQAANDTSEVSEEQQRHEHSVPSAATSSIQKQPSTGVGSRNNGDNRRSILKRSQQPAPVKTNAKKLGFEAAASRPARWSTRKPSAADTNNRRRSLSAIQKRRSQLEAASAKRRKSMPSTGLSQPTALNRFSMDESMSSSQTVPKRRLLSDVLQRATQLSQQQCTPDNDVSMSQAQMQSQENPTDGDAILDTEHQMRAEPFAPQIFSPTKPVSPGTGAGRKTKSDGIISKIRGNVGEVIRKATRKSNRDLTLLRSHGQHLLPQNKTAVSSVGSVQDRPHVVICTKRQRPMTAGFIAYECHIHNVAAELEESTAAYLTTCHSSRSQLLEVLFLPQTAEFLKVTSGKLLKVYGPLHFVPHHTAAGSDAKGHWLLMGTQLTEVVEENFCCPSL